MEAGELKQEGHDKLGRSSHTTIEDEARKILRFARRSLGGDSHLS